MPVNKDQGSLQQGSKVGRRQQLIIFAHQYKSFEAGLRGFRVERRHVDQSTHSLPPTGAPVQDASRLNCARHCVCGL